MHKAIFVVGAGVLVAGIFAAGCGGSSGSGSTGTSGSTETGGGTNTGGSTSSPAKAKFIQQGDAICEKSNKGTEAEFEAYAEKHGIPKNKKPTQAQQEEMIATIALPSIAAQAEELGELAVPSGEEAKVNAIVEGVRKAVEKAEADPGSVFGGGGPFANVNQLAKEYGFEVCGQ